MPTFQDIPQPGDILSVSQVDLENNFAFLSQSLTKDHDIAFSLNSATTEVGYHKKVTLEASINNNIAMPSSADSLLFSFAGNIYWKNPTLAAAVQMTNANVGSPLIAAFGYTFLPGGLMVQWGKTASSGAPLLVNFSPVFSATPYAVLTTVSSATANQSSQVTASNANSFTFAVYTGDTGAISSGKNVFWIAIGPK
jgi:hypothetical protein